MNLYQVAEEISRRLGNIFLRDQDGRRAVYGRTEKFQKDSHWRDLVLFMSTSMVTMEPGLAPVIRPAGPGNSPDNAPLRNHHTGSRA